MADPFVAEIRIFPFNFAPRGWAFCNGQLLSISQNTALFSLLGTTYGGNGQSNFALPDIQGRVVMGNGQGPGLSLRDLGEPGGSDTESLTNAEMPSHGHTENCLGSPPPSVGTTPAATAGLGMSNGGAVYAAGANLGAMNAAVIGTAGNGQPHNNLQPYLTLNFNLALQGVYPPRT